MKQVHSSQIGIFRQLVRDHMERPPPVVPAGTGCAEAVERMRVHAASGILVGAPERLLGIVTEQDVVRQVAYRLPEQTPVEHVMSTPVLTIRDDDYLYHAIARMHRRNLRHLPVVDRRGQLQGQLHLHQALGVASGHALELTDRLTHEETIPGLREVKTAQVEVASILLDERVPAPEIQALLTQVNNDIYRRILERVLQALEEEGWGAPPVPFCTIVMGSGGRGESFLLPDQDNGFILQGYPDQRQGPVDAYFAEVAQRLTRDLAEIGITRCRGDVMATNPLWRKSLPQWCAQVDGWLREPNSKTLRLSDIFFDFDTVFGAGELARELREHVTAAVRDHHPFLAQMQQVQEGHGVALGLFRRLVPDKKDKKKGRRKGRLNLKYHGLLPLVEAIRLLALREGVAETSTLDRIGALHERGVLDRDQQDYLSGALHHLTALLLRQQVEDFKADRAVGVMVPAKILSEREKDLLVDALNAVKDLREYVRSELTGQVF